MVSLLESGISQEIIDELKIAIEKQCKKEIENLSDIIADKFIRNGYTKDELTFTCEMSVESYDLKAWLWVGYKTTDGANESKATQSYWLKRTDSNFIKELNTVIAKVVNYYNEKAAVLIDETNSILLSDETPKLLHGYNDIRFDIKGLNVRCYENPYLIERKAISTEIEERLKFHTQRVKDKIASDKQAEIDKKETKKQELKVWAMENGSELLKARIEENMNWFNMANEEWFTSVCPKGFKQHDDAEFDSCWDYNNPTMEHINELRKARENTLFCSVGLRKCRKNEDGENTFYFFVEAQFKAFDGIEIYNVSKVIDTDTEE